MDAISVIGLGKLGACTAAALASRGFEVIGVDIAEHTVGLINSGIAPMEEPLLQETITHHRDRLRATLSYTEAVLASDVTFIVVQTPTDDRGGFALDHARGAAAEVGRALAHKDAYHLVVLTSTVLPGATERDIVPVIERFSGKRAGRDFGLCYSPEFIALGSVINDFLNPDFVLIGEYDERSGARLASVYRQACENDPPIRRMNIVNAEIVKLAVNTFVTTKITFANMLAELCSEIAGADVDVVADAMGSDTRIGRSYLTGGLSYGGPCFPRDNIALAYLARRVGANGNLAVATNEYNQHHLQWVVERTCALLGPGDSVAVIGLAYRPDTNIIERSAGMYLVQALVDRGIAVTVYDEHALNSARQVLKDSVAYATSVTGCARSGNVVVLTDTSGAARSLTADTFVRDDKRRTTVIDCWRVCNQDVVRSSAVRYFGLGVGSTHDAAAELAPSIAS